MMFHIKNLKIIFIFLLVTSLTVPVFADSESEFEILFKNGFDAVKTGDLDTALSFFNQALELDPDNLVVLSNKAGILLQLKQYEDANSVLDNALTLDPLHKGSLINKALILYYQEKFLESEVYFDKVLNVDPTSIFALTMKSAVLIKLERMEQAEDLLNQVLLKDPNDPLALSFKLDILINKGEKSKALPLLKKLGDLEPSLLSKFDIEKEFGLKWKKVIGLVEITITDSENNLIGYLQTKKIRILDHSAVDLLFDEWEYRGNTIVDGIEYEIFHQETHTLAPKSMFAGRTGFGISPQNDNFSEGSVHDMWILTAIHSQYSIKENDSIGIFYTILRPVS